MITSSFNKKIYTSSVVSRLFIRSLQTSRTQDNVQTTKTKARKGRHELRNIGIVAHINAGKTTTTERILYHAGSTWTVGDVDKGNTVTDYLVQERDRGITITSAAVSYNWKKHRINLIDTPGHVDFTMEVERSLAVLDGAVTIIDSSAGVEAQTTTVWNQAKKYQLPNIIFLNKYDKPQADYKMCLKDLKTSLDIQAFLVQLPIKNKAGTFSTVLDILDRQSVTWKEPEGDHGASFKVEDLKNSNVDKLHLDSVEEEREKLINFVSDVDDVFANHVLECEKISHTSGQLLKEALRRLTLSCQISPVLVGSSFKYIGVQQLMDAIVAYLPSPIEREVQVLTSMSGHISENCDSACAFIFKIMHDKRLGTLTYLRVCNGSIYKMQRVRNVESGNMEQIKRVYRVFADELQEVDEAAKKDDIVVVTGLTESRTGTIIVDKSFPVQYETTTTESSSKTETKTATGESKELLPFRLLNNQIIVPRINHMEPVYFCTIESKSSAQQLKLEQALNCLSLEDPSFSYEIDELGITTIRGMGKLHLEVVRDRIQSEYEIEPLLGPLQIAYRETIEGSATEELTVDRYVNSVKNSLFIKLYVRSKPKSGTWTGKMLRLDTSGESSLGKLRNDHRKAIELGFCSTLAHGPTMGYPLIDCDILLLDFHANSRCGLPLISSTASQCLMSAINRCSPLLLEPIMLLEVVVPSEHNGLILGDITARRGVLLSTSARLGGSIVIRSQTPLSELANYSEYLRVVTSGRGSFSMELHSYSAMSESARQSVEQH